MRGGLRDKGCRISADSQKRKPRPRKKNLGEANTKRGTGRGFQVTLAAATDSRDAQIPGLESKHLTVFDAPDEGPTNGIKRWHSYW